MYFLISCLLGTKENQILPCKILYASVNDGLCQLNYIYPTNAQHYSIYDKVIMHYK